MRDITANKADLVKIIKANRANHLKKFVRAYDAYRERVIKALDQRRDEALRGGAVRLYFDLPEPQDHTDDYDNALEMLALHTGDTIELSEKDVQMYVRDNWGWMKSFETTNQFYAVS